MGCAASRVLFEGAWFSSGEPRPCFCFAAGARFCRLLGLPLLSLSVRLFPPLPSLRLQPLQLHSANRLCTASSHALRVASLMTWKL